MAQKYKVFIEERVIYFTEIEIDNLPFQPTFQPENYQELVSKLEFPVSQVVSENAKKALLSFFFNFKYIEAAGGIVESEKGGLYIKRHGKWDIPKGKMEKGEGSKETAIREIEEECGLIGKLEVQRKLLNTYHVYEMREKSFLKKTHWYLLSFEGESTLKAQEEEGITEVVWKSKQESGEMQKNTFSSVNDVLVCYLNS
jgi:ADP-ribose pyrophosphatase YjhB (NUDIX family)